MTRAAPRSCGASATATWRRNRWSGPSSTRRSARAAAIARCRSNCIAIEPLETPLGRKREINQSACNVDLSCLKGFCPSFVTIKGVQPRKGEGVALKADDLPEPPVPPVLDTPFNIAVTGIGGTGVLTIGGIIGMAAHLDEKAAMVLEVSGLAQKGGAVISHIRLCSDPDHISTPRIAGGCADLLLAADSVVAISREGMEMISAARTAAIVNGHTAPVSNFVRDRDFDFRQDSVLQAIKDNVKPGARIVDFHRFATKVIGDAIAANMMMVGYAWQLGLLPLSEAALMRATEMNGVAVAMNKTAFRWGRVAAADPERIAELLVPAKDARAVGDMTLDEIISHRAQHLTAYQDAALAEKFRAAVSRIRTVESKLGSDALTRAVAINYAKVLAYKDEYEVARLLTRSRFRAGIERNLRGRRQIEFPSGATADFQDRSRSRAAEEAALRRGPAGTLALDGEAEVSARHGVRYLRTDRGAQARARVDHGL